MKEDGVGKRAERGLRLGGRGGGGGSSQSIRVFVPHEVMTTD